MAAVTAPLLEAGDTGRQIQLIMGHQDRFNRNLKKLG